MGVCWCKKGRAKVLRLRAAEDDDKRRSIVVIELGGNGRQKCSGEGEKDSGV